MNRLVRKRMQIEGQRTCDHRDAPAHCDPERMFKTDRVREIRKTLKLDEGQGMTHGNKHLDRRIG